MAKIQVSKKCFLCGNYLKSEEAAVIISECRLTSNPTYGYYTNGLSRGSELRVNFYSYMKKHGIHQHCWEKSGGWDVLKKNAGVDEEETEVEPSNEPNQG
jgi:hypothetical protein